MEEAVRRRVALEKEAYHIVEQLVEAENITEEWISTAVQAISPEHYQDVVEERAIAKVCGYPLCANPVDPNRVKKQYHISTKQNKVFDITERKNFCSNICYKASKFLENQIPQSPVWARENEIFTKVTLLRQDEPSSTENDTSSPSSSSSLSLSAGVVNSGHSCDVPLSFTASSESNPLSSLSSSTGITNFSIGDEVISSEKRIESELKQLERTDNLQSGLLYLSESMTRLDVSSYREQANINSSSTASSSHGAHGFSTSPSQSKRSYAELIHILFEWRTEQSVDFLLGYSIDHDFNDDHDHDAIHDNPYDYAGKSFEKLLHSKDSDELNSSLRRLPDYEQIRVQANAKQLRIAESSHESTPQRQDADATVALPLVDSKSQRAIRCKIIMEKLISILKHFLHASFALPIGELATEIKFLAATFQTTNENIVLKPAEWTKIGVLLLFLLKERARTLNQPYLDRIDAEKLRQMMGFSSEQLDAFIINYINI